ncbi:hypothetical protein VTH06DRAFT_8185 [Thermothelomyces fergusii]
MFPDPSAMPQYAGPMTRANGKPIDHILEMHIIAQRRTLSPEPRVNISKSPQQPPPPPQVLTSTEKGTRDNASFFQ